MLPRHLVWAVLFLLLCLAYSWVYLKLGQIKQLKELEIDKAIAVPIYKPDLILIFNPHEICYILYFALIIGSYRRLSVKMSTANVLFSKATCVWLEAK